MTRLRRFITWLLPRLGLAFPLAIALGFFLHRVVLPEVVWRIYQMEVPHHELAHPNISHGAGAEDLEYLLMTYDCDEGDIVIDGRAPDSKYWMVGIYDNWARAVTGGHLHHRDAVVTDGRFEVRITADYRGAPNELDCSEKRRGLVMYRIIRAHGPVEVPTVSVTPTDG